MLPRNHIPSHAKRVFSGVMFDVYQWEQELYDGTKTTFEKVKRADVAVIIATDTDGKVIIVRQDQPNNPNLVSTPSGRVDPGEAPFDTAKRELLEETGYVSEDWQEWKALYPNEKIEQYARYYIARGCHKVGEICPDPGEKINVELMNFNEFVKLAESETYRDWILATQILRMHVTGELESFRLLIGAK